jgi:hypothetical protein
VSDVFNEIDEELRLDKLKTLWQRYSSLIVAGAVLVVVLIAGWRAYEWREGQKGAEAGAAFLAAVSLSEQGKHAEAEAALAKVPDVGASGYRDLVRLRAAAELAQRDPKAAIEAYDSIASDTRVPQLLRDLAAVRAGFIVVDAAPFDEVGRRLEPLAAPNRPFRNTARELLGLAAWRASDLAAARKWFDMIMSDVEASSGTRQRIEMLMALAGDNGKS